MLPLQPKTGAGQTTLRAGAAGGWKTPLQTAESQAKLGPSRRARSNLGFQGCPVYSVEMGGQGALGSWGLPFSQPLREGAVAQLMSGLERKINSLLDISTPFISTRHRQPRSLRARG